jgi:hypothetical protein
MKPMEQSTASEGNDPIRTVLLVPDDLVGRASEQSAALGVGLCELGRLHFVEPLLELPTENAGVVERFRGGH